VFTVLVTRLIFCCTVHCISVDWFGFQLSWLDMHSTEW